MKRFFFIAVAFILLLAPTLVRAEEDACALVKIEIAQELTLERIAFDARLVITNNIADQNLENVRVEVYIRNLPGDDKGDMFFTRLSSLDGIDSVDGTSAVLSSSTADIHWLIIPSTGAGGSDPAGTEYMVGATLTYTLNEVEETIAISPDTITVKPSPELYLDYFQPFRVLADNPFTPVVEAPVPYQLAVRVMNDGYGTAAKLHIDSAQPTITENTSGLLIDFQLLGTSVNDSTVDPSLTVDMGDVASKEAATAFWEMISTLSGKFEEFKVSFTHSSELGGELTSIIKETNAHYLIHRVKANLPGRDTLLDFLADSTGDTDELPDYIYESEIPNDTGFRADSVSPVTVVYPVAPPERPTAGAPSVDLTVDLAGAGNPTGWIYTELTDPADGLLHLLDVVRADGVRIDPNNFWVDEGLDEDYQTIHTLRFVDHRTAGTEPATYRLVYKEPDVDNIAPTSTFVLDGPDTGPLIPGGPVYITPLTRLVMTAQDNDGGSGVAEMLRKVVETDAGFSPAFPFNIIDEGPYTLEYFSKDRAGNMEAVRTLAIVVDDSAPLIALFTASPAEFTPMVPAGVAADTTVDFTVNATDAVGVMEATIEILDVAGIVVKTLTATAASGTDLIVTWDGNDDEGNMVSTGDYTARLTVTDGLDTSVDPDATPHSTISEITVTAAEWFEETAVDPTGADQMYPDASGTRVVWQDFRNDNWDIYVEDLAAGAVEPETLGAGPLATQLTTNAFDQTRPAIDGDTVVWQDFGTDWDIKGYDLATDTAFTVEVGGGDQTKPAVSGSWVVWQDFRSGNWDIFARDTATSDPAIRITSHERDQINPAIDGTVLVWEDYRHGAAEIYKVDLSSDPIAEERVTVDVSNQTLPALSGDTFVWTDQRDGDKEIYRYDASKGVLRVTYGGGHTGADALGSLLVYTDYEAGLGDPNLSFQDILSGIGGRLTSNPAVQEEGAIGTGLVAWQDTRDGVYQVYYAPLDVTALPISVEIRSGFNLIAVGQSFVDAYGTASVFLSETNAVAGGVTIEKALAHSSLHDTYTEATTSAGDFALTKGMGLVVYAGSKGAIEVAGSDEQAVYALQAGTNLIGMLAVPTGYNAYDLIDSVGMENIQSVRKFNNWTGSWETVSTRPAATGEGFEKVGHNFQVNSGDGLVITMKARVDGWRP